LFYRRELVHARPFADSVADRVVDTIVGIVASVTVSISITLDDELGAELNAAVAGGNRSSVVAEAIREYLDRRAIAAAAAWHASLTGEDAATLAEFNGAW
jgi:predicted transcriptional regulator